VGPSGSGKSSIVSLILRFYDLTDGQIKIDGRDIKDINISALRERVGFVSQEPTLFSGSLRENVEYGLREVEGKEQLVLESLEVANAKEFVFNESLFP
jgi:ABC-type multidrug transport system fused ATPase/permease subunit